MQYSPEVDSDFSVPDQRVGTRRRLEGSSVPFVWTNFYKLLTEWVPMEVISILLARQLSAHAKNFNMPLPSNLTPELNGDQVSVNSNQTRETGVKLMELMKLHLEYLRDVTKRGAEGGDHMRGAMPLDLVTRYVTTATREMERALSRYGS